MGSIPTLGTRKIANYPIFCYIFEANLYPPLAQLVELLPLKEKVVGSIPTGRTSGSKSRENQFSRLFAFVDTNELSCKVCINFFLFMSRTHHPLYCPVRTLPAVFRAELSVRGSVHYERVENNEVRLYTYNPLFGAIKAFEIHIVEKDSPKPSGTEKIEGEPEVLGKKCSIYVGS